MHRFLQIIQMLLATIFIILTLGFISVEMEWDDGTCFKYRGWQIRKKKSDFQRLRECLTCEYIDRCRNEVLEPLEHPDGSCKQREMFIWGGRR